MSPPELHIFVAGPQHHPIAVALLRAQFDDHDTAFPPGQLEAATLGFLIDPERGAVLIAELAGVPVGIAALPYTWTLEHGGQVAWLDELYVAPEHRNRGIGRALLDRAVTHAAASGCRAVDLEVMAGHEGAGRLYERAGFRPLPRVRWALRLDAPAEER